MNSGILPQTNAGPTPTPKRPTKMHINIGGYFGSNYSLTYEGKQLKYHSDEHRQGDPIEAVITPSHSQGSCVPCVACLADDISRIAERRKSA